MKIFLLVALFGLIAVLVFLALYLVIGYTLYRLILTRKGKMVKNIVKKCEFADECLDFSSYSKIHIQSGDNLKLVGFYKDNDCGKLALLVHGYGGSHQSMSAQAQYFEKRGYDILAVDLRSHGQSEGKDITMGEKESEDLLLWIDKMLSLKSQYKIVLLGVSMGASTVCMTAGRQVPLNVVCGIEDCGYDNADKELRYMFLQHKILTKLFYSIFYNFTKKSRGLDLKKVDAITKLKASRLPFLFIHGECDKIVPLEMVYSLSSALPPIRKDVKIFKDAGHVGSYKSDKIGYEKALSSFLNKYSM